MGKCGIEMSDLLLTQNRIYIIQTLYALDIRLSVIESNGKAYSEEDILQIIQDTLSVEQIDEEEIKKLIVIITKITNDIMIIDQYISKYLSNSWKIERLAKVLLAILRSATFEIINKPSQKLGTIINDYIEITRSFEHHSEASFINAILDNIAKEVMSSADIQKTSA